MKPLAVLLCCSFALCLHPQEPAALKLTKTIPLSGVDEANQRLFIGCRQPPRLVVLDTATGKSVADLAISGDTDDLFYDAARKRLYLPCGDGFVDLIDQLSADSYKLRERIPTSPGARTSFFSPDLNEFYLAVRMRGQQTAEIRVYQVQK